MDNARGLLVLAGKEASHLGLLTKQTLLCNEKKTTYYTLVK